MTTVRASYNALADMVMGQIGEPGLASFVPITDELILMVRRDDPARPHGFHLEDARESLSRHEEWFINHFGSDFAREVAALFDKANDVDLDGVADEDLDKVLPTAIARVEVEVPQLDGPQLWAKEAYEAFELSIGR